MYTNMTGLSRRRACLALALPMFLLAACTDAGQVAAPSAPQLTPATGSRADIREEAWLKGSVSVLLQGPYGVASQVQASPIARVVHSEVSASIRTLRNWHGSISNIEVFNQCTWLNGTICSTWDDIPDYCSVRPDEPDEGAPGAEGQASGTMSAAWDGWGLSTYAFAQNSCPSVIGRSGGGGGGGSGPGSGGTTCYEAWYVWADGSNPDQFIGIVCFGGGTNAS